jgi:hypothetical protein
MMAFVAERRHRDVRDCEHGDAGKRDRFLRH